MKDNIILRTDAYKQTHWLQYPKGTTKIYSYLESRGGKFDNTVFFGLQILLKKYFEGVVVEQWMIDEAEAFCKDVFGTDKFFNRDGWQRIVDIHGGKLPIVIKAVPEGTIVPVSNVLMTVENTDPQLPFLTNFVETLLMQLWYPITVSTLSYHIKLLIEKYAVRMGTHVTPFHLNDFGFRGVSSVESAGIGGAAHLVHFLGTDTLEGIQYAKKYYDAKVGGFSVMASEHSTTTVYGRENEAKAYETFIDNCPNGILSLVSDSYDIYNACDNIFGKELKDKILKRGGKLVVRPDSGDPSQISIQVLQSLWNSFGGTVNEKGYKILNPKVGVIYGDGINYESINSILFRMELAGFSTDNLVFGMGGALLQQVNRDTQKFAFKCSAAEINGKWVDVYKDPITDNGKRSKRGKLELIKDYDTGNYETVNVKDVEKKYGKSECLNTVFENGKIIQEYSFEEVRAMTNIQPKEIVKSA